MRLAFADGENLCMTAARALMFDYRCGVLLQMYDNGGNDVQGAIRAAPRISLSLLEFIRQTSACSV
jgi:hypothetical protein